MQGPRRSYANGTSTISSSKATATPTNAAPMPTIGLLPTVEILRSVQTQIRPRTALRWQPHETRRANLASQISMKGMTIGNVDKKLSRQMAIA